MKQVKNLLFVVLILVPMFSFAGKKDPIIVEIQTSHTSIKSALIACKMALIKQKFINTSGMQESSFVSTRTTGSKADYYTADVMADMVNGKAKLTITLIKSGSGMLKLSKVANKLRAELGASNETGAIGTSSGGSVVVQKTKPQPNPLSCKKYQNMSKAGSWLIVGGGTCMLGSLINITPKGSASNVGLFRLGMLSAAGGITLKLIGNKKKNEYCALNMSLQTNGVAFVLNM